MRSCTSSRTSSGPRAGNGQRPGSDELGTRSELLIIGKMIAGGTTNVICKHYDGGAIWRVLSLQHVPSVDWLLCIVFGSCGLFGHSLQLVIICHPLPGRSEPKRPLPPQHFAALVRSLDHGLFHGRFIHFGPMAFILGCSTTCCCCSSWPTSCWECGRMDIGRAKRDLGPGVRNGA